MPTKSSPVAIRGSRNDAVELVKSSLDQLQQSVAKDANKFFPNGVELIDFTVKISSIEVKLKVAGPKAGQLLSGSDTVPMGAVTTDAP